ncbi:hypothetical protein GCM10009762_29250 [Dermacoccus barathri]|uniref:Uncharacterized protein n=1 Tax=Dermacoccus barathri TaxID=322601 RepID=A0ABN2C8Q6_9MICO
MIDGLVDHGFGRTIQLLVRLMWRTHVSPFPPAASGAGTMCCESHLGVSDKPYGGQVFHAVRGATYSPVSIGL